MFNCDFRACTSHSQQNKEGCNDYGLTNGTVTTVFKDTH